MSSFSSHGAGSTPIGWRIGPLVGSVLALMAWASGPAAAQRNQPPRPAPRVEILDPDQRTCQPAVIREAFERNLQPYAAQPERVLAKLRLLQLELTERSISRCVETGRMSAQDAQMLRTDLGLAAQTPSPPSDARP